MAGGLDTDLALEHYLSRRLTQQTPFANAQGALLGEVPPGALIVGVNVFIVQSYPATAFCWFSFTPNSADQFAACAVETPNLGYGNTVVQAPEVNFLRSGRIYCGVVTPAGPGICIPSLRFATEVQ